MTIYEFSLLTMSVFTGVDTSICYRNSILKQAGFDVKLIFTYPPSQRDFKQYLERGIDIESVLDLHLSFTDFESIKPCKPVQEILEELKDTIVYTDISNEEDVIRLSKDGTVVADILLTADKTSFYSVRYYHHLALMREDFYTDKRYASCYYETKEKEDGIKYSLPANRIFFNRNGSVCFSQILYGSERQNIFNDGNAYNGEQLFSLFIKRLKLSKDDVVFIDRSLGVFPMKPLFECSNDTNLVAIVHSEHFFEKGRSTEGYTLNREYWYWCKYSQYLRNMFVGTDLQKERLTAYLEEKGLAVPDIEVMPPFGLDSLRYPEGERKKKSLLCVSRLDDRKKISWTIYAAIRAHQEDEDITLDIYGYGTKEYTDYLQKIIDMNSASDYITLKGYADVTEQYQNYELFITTSLWETFGIALLEATGSGLPIVGLDVEYGNMQFIIDGENGYRVPYNRDHFDVEAPEEIDLIADRILELLNDDEKRERFSEASYEIAKEYLPENMETKWIKFLQEIRNHQ